MLTLKNILHLITESLKDVTHIYTCRYTMHTTYNTVCEKTTTSRTDPCKSLFFRAGFKNNSIK